MRRFLAGLRARLRDVVLRGAAEREMDEELRFHVEMETEKNLRLGLEPREARRRALAAFGGVDRHREALREGRRVPILAPLANDLRFGIRALRREPGLSFVIVLTVALGIGAATIVASTANAILFRLLPLPGAERLVTIQEARSGLVSTGVEGMLIPYDRYLAYRERTGGVFESLAAHRLVDAFSLRLPDATIAVGGALTSGNYFQTLGVRPALGRVYGADDAAEVVISYDLWSSRFAADSTIIGQSLTVDGQSATVVGVAPSGFSGATIVVNQMWVPIRFRSADVESWVTRVVPLGRIAPGVSTERAQAVVGELARAIPPEENSRVRSAQLEPVSVVPGVMRGSVMGFLGILQGMSLLLLGIAAANIAGLMLARGVARRREMAVRQAIGANRGRLVRHLLSESLVLFTLGAVLGIGVAYGGTRWLAGIEFPPPVPDVLLDLTPDGRVLGLAVLTALVLSCISTRYDAYCLPMEEEATLVGGASPWEERQRSC